MKILLAASCPSDRNLGVPGVMHCLGDEFANAGHEVRYLFRDEPGRIGEMLFGLRLSSSPLSRWADVVDVHAVDAWPLCGQRHGPVVVARSHGLELAVHRRLLAAASRGETAPSRIYWLYRGSIRLWLERMAARQADAMLVLNDSDRRICLGELGGTPTRIQMVPNGYPKSFLDHPANPGRGVAFVGSWIHRKGNDLAAAALSDLVRSGFDGRILLLGGGVPTETILADFPEDVRPRLDIRPRFTRPELPALLDGCGVLLFPSRSEGYPLALVEAMACGVAPVATAIPGVVELVTNRVNGRLVPAEDPAALSKALAEILADQDTLGKLCGVARDSVRATSWDAIAESQLALYRDLLKPEGPPMRIAFVLPNYSGHIVGSLLVYYRYAMDLAAHGHQVDLWHPAVDRETVGIRQMLRARLWAFARGLRRHPIPWQEFPDGIRPRFRHGFRGLELDHDIVVAFSWRGIESLSDIRTTGSLFGYVVEYETWAEAAPPMRERMESAYKSGLPLLCSSIVVEEMLRSTGAPDVRSCVHGIDRSVYRLDVPVSGRPSQRVGCPVRSEAVKSPEVLRATLIRLREAPGLRLSLWGFGGANPPEGIRELLDEYHVHPSHEELARLHNGSAIFFVPSRKEGFGMPAAEAMSCGCALASCDNGGVRTFAYDGIDAILVPPDDPVALADAVLRLRDDHELRVGIASRAVESTAFLDWAIAGQRFRKEIGA